MCFVAAATGLKLIIHVRTGFNATDETEGLHYISAFFSENPSNMS